MKDHQSMINVGHIASLVEAFNQAHADLPLLWGFDQRDKPRVEDGSVVVGSYSDSYTRPAMTPEQDANLEELIASLKPYIYDGVLHLDVDDRQKE